MPAAACVYPPIAARPMKKWRVRSRAGRRCCRPGCPRPRARPRSCRRCRRIAVMMAARPASHCTSTGSMMAPRWRARRMQSMACACSCAHWAASRRWTGCWMDAGSHRPVVRS
ncbi:hypothetical protein G6F50_017853 [Rhizopus delemar]|uniref:Uncharacterized protein n=1 Tax=Rhizopus delemar TaxID=936053 RepID=A0A9P6XP56_9FUNG|nr:hypothetical protein G6F50_017853 [Rhizopus delemar]